MDQPSTQDTRPRTEHESRMDADVSVSDAESVLILLCLEQRQTPNSEDKNSAA